MREARLQGFARTMRREPTPAEQRPWFELRAGRLRGVRFRRQKVVGRHIVDFAARDPMLVVEVDGHTHDGGSEEQARTGALEAAGYDVIRFANEDVVRRLEGVLEVLTDRIRELRSQPSPLQRRGESREDPTKVVLSWVPGAAEGEGNEPGQHRTRSPYRSPLPSAPDGAPSLSPEGERA